MKKVNIIRSIITVIGFVLILIAIIISKNEKNAILDNTNIDESPSITEEIEDSNDEPSSDNTQNSIVNEDTSIEKESTKLISVEVSIDYKTVEENEINMFRGTRKTVKSGVNGTRVDTYQVVYDSNNNEISKKKVSEAITISPVNEVIKVGISDYNLNKDTYTNITNGIICPHEYLFDAGENYECVYDENDYSPVGFAGIFIGNKGYITSTVANGVIEADTYKSNLSIATSNNQQLYLIRLMEENNNKLTQEICNVYSLACGSW